MTQKIRRPQIHTTSEQTNLQDVENEVNEFLNVLPERYYISNQILTVPIKHPFVTHAFVGIITYIAEVEPLLGE